MKIDFISDVACPWCAVGLNALELALQRLGPDAAVTLHFQPFELSPGMAAEGADAGDYLKAKYGMGDEQLVANRAHLRERGAAVGFQFGDRLRVWNTFDAHRLLHWAGLQDGPPTPPAGLQDGPPTHPAGLQGGDVQRRLKHALLQAYHGDGRNPGAHDVLLELAAACGLDTQVAAQEP